MTNNESLFSCPVCGTPLYKEVGQYKCINNHTFDISRQGYVNLLMSMTSKNKRHGDDKLMVKSRRDFLGNGYYSKLSKEICSNNSPSVYNWSNHSNTCVC